MPKFISFRLAGRTPFYVLGLINGNQSVIQPKIDFRHQPFDIFFHHTLFLSVLSAIYLNPNPDKPEFNIDD